MQSSRQCYLHIAVKLHKCDDAILCCLINEDGVSTKPSVPNERHQDQARKRNMKGDPSAMDERRHASCPAESSTVLYRSSLLTMTLYRDDVFEMVMCCHRSRPSARRPR